MLWMKQYTVIQYNIVIQMTTQEKNLNISLLFHSECGAELSERIDRWIYTDYNAYSGYHHVKLVSFLF